LSHNTVVAVHVDSGGRADSSYRAVQGEFDCRDCARGAVYRVDQRMELPAIMKRFQEGVGSVLEFHRYDSQAGNMLGKMMAESGARSGCRHLIQRFGESRVH
jgi:hypothetical protein